MQFKPPKIVSSIQKAVDAVKVNPGLDAFKKAADNGELAFVWAMYDETKNPYFALDCVRLCLEQHREPPAEVSDYLHDVLSGALAHGDLRKAIDPDQKNAFDAYKRAKRNVRVVIEYLNLVDEGETKTSARKQVLSNLERPIGDRQLERIVAKYTYILSKPVPRLKK